MWQLDFMKILGAKSVRMEFAIGTPTSQMEPIIDAYARAGIQPLLLAGFQGRTPTTAEAQTLASWAAAFGPGGTFWQGKSYPAGTAVTDIEFGNETNNPWQFSSSPASDWYKEPSFIERAKTYALRFKDAQIAVQQANPNVGLLAIGDQYSGYTTWVDAMFQAVPDLGQRVAGWTAHPYGPRWNVSVDNMIAATRAHGAPGDVPIYLTEWGLSTDDGRCLSDNYGWDKCMSYSAAASTLDSTIAAMRARYGSRLAAIYLYQATDQRNPDESTDREHYFGALHLDMSPKGAYTTEVESLLAANQ